MLKQSPTTKPADYFADIVSAFSLDGSLEKISQEAKYIRAFLAHPDRTRIEYVLALLIHLGNSTDQLENSPAARIFEYMERSPKTYKETLSLLFAGVACHPIDTILLPSGKEELYPVFFDRLLEAPPALSLATGYINNLDRQFNKAELHITPLKQHSIKSLLQSLYDDYEYRLTVLQKCHLDYTSARTAPPKQIEASVKTVAPVPVNAANPEATLAVPDGEYTATQLESLGIFLYGSRAREVYTVLAGALRTKADNKTMPLDCVYDLHKELRILKKQAQEMFGGQLIIVGAWTIVQTPLFVSRLVTGPIDSPGGLVSFLGLGVTALVWLSTILNKNNLENSLVQKKAAFQK